MALLFLSFCVCHSLVRQLISIFFSSNNQHDSYPLMGLCSVSKDTAGQERYRSLAPMYYRGAAAAIVVYDITNPDSFTGAKSWVKELQRRGDPNVVIAMAGNKA